MCVSANDDSIDNMVDYLVSCGLHEDFFVGMEESDIREMYNDLIGQNIVFLGSDTHTISNADNQDSLNTVNSLLYGDGGSTSEVYGVIPSSDMTFTITKLANVTYDSERGADKINKIYVYVDYIWEEDKPVNRWSDGITVNWDSAVFTFESDSFVARDYKRVMSSNWEWVKTNESFDPASLNIGGLGYYAVLSYAEENAGGVQVAPKQHKGTAYFTLLPSESPIYLESGSQTTAINANYLHNKNLGIFSVSFSYKGLGVTASVPLLHDSVAVATNVYYSH